MNLEEAIRTQNSLPAAYVLSNSERSYLYKGASRNLVKRMKDHKAGRVSKTKNKRPLELVYFEYCDDFTEARQRENFFKTGKGRDFIKKNLN